MSEKKEKPKQFRTPRVTFIYPRLNTPDGKYKPLNPEFSVRFAADPNDPVIAEIVQLLDTAASAAESQARKEIAENKSLNPKKRAEKLEKLQVTRGYEEEYDDQDQPTGMLLFKASTGSVFTTKEGKKVKRQVPIVDAKRIDITKRAPQIGGGSEGRLIVTVGSGVTEMGAYAKLYLSAVQLLKLVAPGSAVAGMFDEEEDGFSADDYGMSDERDTEEVGEESDDEL